MKLLELPTFQFVLNIIGIFVCLFVLFSAICRVNIAGVMRGRLSPAQVQYIAMGAWALGNMIALARGEVIEAWDAAAGIAFVLHLAVTFDAWRDRPHEQSTYDGGVEC